MPKQPADADDHYSDCPAVTGDGPEWAPTKCRCEYLAKLDEDYHTEPPNMSAREWGSY